MRTPRFIQSHAADSIDERAAAQAALLAPAASASPKFFYDRLGSHLFEAITELPEYYPTRTEAAIFERHAGDLARCTGTGMTLVDLGALEPLNPDSSDWSFGAQCIVAARAASRLRSDFELDTQSLAVVLSLLERVQELEMELQRVHARLPRLHR